MYITYNSVSIPTPWAVAGPDGQLSKIKMWGGGVREKITLHVYYILFDQYTHPMGSWRVFLCSFEDDCGNPGGMTVKQLSISVRPPERQKILNFLKYHWK